MRNCGRSLLPSCPNQIRSNGVRYEANIILRCVRWYCSYPLSYRQVAEMVNERGMDVHHTTVFRWVQQYGPELDKRCRPHLRPTNDSWRVNQLNLILLPLHATSDTTIN